MKLVSVNVSMPKTVDHLGRQVSTGIYNEPVAGRVWVRKLNVDGDGQADLTVHGGVYKAVYVYDLENINYWFGAARSKKSWLPPGKKERNAKYRKGHGLLHLWPAAFYEFYDEGVVGMGCTGKTHPFRALRPGSPVARGHPSQTSQKEKSSARGGL